MKVNKRELSEIFGVTQQTLDKWQHAGMPHKKGVKGRENEYDTAECIDWRMHGQDIDYKKERARLTKAQADEQEMKNQIMNGELVAADDIIEKWSTIATNVKNRMLSVPSRAATLLQGVDGVKETKKIIEGLVKEALKEIAGD